MNKHAVGAFIPPLQPDGLAEQQTLLASFELQRRDVSGNSPRASKFVKRVEIQCPGVTSSITVACD